MKNERNKIIPASYLVLLKNDRVLLLRRYNTGYEDGNYSLPAGHVESGENFTQCVVRESKEEVGILVNSESLKVAHIMHRNEGENNERIDTFFVAEKWSGEIENKEPEKCDDLSWFNLSDLPDNILPMIKLALENIKNDIFYSEIGWK